MQNPKSSPHCKKSAGFTLPAILVVVGALLILAVGVLLIVGIERNTARSFVDKQRAELAAKAGLEEVSGIFNTEAANDDFLVIQSTLTAAVAPAPAPLLQASPQLFIVRGKAATTTNSPPTFQYTPLFSTYLNPKTPAASPKVPETSALTLPQVEPLFDTDSKTFIDYETLPYQDKARASWLPVTDSNNKMVGRYSYWVEDLQSRVDAGTAGNTKDSGTHQRYGWKGGSAPNSARFPAPGLNAEISKPGTDGRDAEPPLNQVALYLLDPASAAKDTSALDKTIIDGRKALVSPDSTLAVAGILPPLTRGTDGHLLDIKARAVEEGLSASVQPYDERAVIPYAKGIDSSVAGKPKLNLNSLLAKPANDAVEEMAAFIKKGLPDFDDVNKPGGRPGGFPDNYLKTLSANAIDYADADTDATVSQGGIMGKQAYRGLDAYPLMSEVILHIKYLGTATLKGRKVLLWQIILFAELWNHTSEKVTGSARLSYENKMRPPAISAGVADDYFDSPELLGDKNQTQHTLSQIGGRYWSDKIAVSLAPNQYQFYKAATINYTIDVGPSTQTLQNTFEIYEDLGSSGISLMWNDREVDRNDKLIRGNSSPTNPELVYITNFKKQSGKANIPGHSYGVYNTNNNYKNNMGDSRQALYLRGDAYPLSDNSYPGNVSPNRRNIRNVTIYKNGLGQANVYGRVLPSEWPDGGHDSDVSGLPLSAPAVDDYDPTNTTLYPPQPNTREGDAPTFISNRGRFYSATELGRVYDPIMYTPMYDKSSDSSALLKGQMPAGRVSWPSVELGDTSDIYYGGGNTLRIGRPEHPKFDQPAKHAPLDMPGTHAARLLDLFHTGKSRSDKNTDREGPLVRIEGNINLNTASIDAIRAMAGGVLAADARLVKRTSDTHSTSTSAPPVSLLEVSTPTTSKEADLLAEAIIRGRPYSSPSEIACALGTDGKPVFGNRDILPEGNKTQWSDSAAEEAFARVYESSTVRSRNFRVWVVGQSVAPTATTNTAPEVLAEVRRAYTVFADPGARNSNGTIDSTKFKIQLLNENDF